MSLKNRTLFFAILLCIFSSHTRAMTLTDPNYGFTLKIPDGFVTDPGIAGVRPEFLYAFRKPSGGASISDPIIIISKLNGTIGQGHLRIEDMPKTFEGSLFTAHWHGFDVQGVHVLEEVAGMQIVTYKAEVPLQHVAIQVWAAGSVDQDEKTRQLLDQLLANLEGQSNWSANSTSVGTGGTFGSTGMISSVGLFGLIGGVIGGMKVLGRHLKGLNNA